MAKIEGAFNLPFREQLAFWERKEVKGTLHWQDISRAEHDKNFVVAGAMKADLLHDLQASLKGLQGGSLETFRKNFREIVAKHGWHGWTGEGTAKGEAWRTKVIWQTNIRASYAAGRYAQLTSPEAREALPYWKYMHSNLVKTPRQDHLEWHGLTLPNDHPFWKKAFPPNGFGCRCYVIGVMEPDENARTVPPEGWESKIGKGWDYAPGESVADEVRQIVAAKAEKLPPPLAKEMLAQGLESKSFADWFAAPEKGTAWPLAILPDEDAKAIGAKAGVRVGKMSDETATKQWGEHPELTPDEYAKAQTVVDYPTNKRQDAPNSMIYIQEEPSEISGGYVLAVKATLTGNALWFTSFRRLPRREAERDSEIRRLLKKGRK